MSVGNIVLLQYLGYNIVLKQAKIKCVKPIGQLCVITKLSACKRAACKIY